MPNFSATNLPVRDIEDLRKLTYQEMNSGELDKLRSEDPDTFKSVVEAVDGKPEPVEIPAEPVVSAKRTIWRNGLPVEVPTAVQYINGIAVG